MTQASKVEMAPGIAAYRNRFRHVLTLRWVRDNGEQVARHGQIVGWVADPDTGEQWLRLALTGRDKTIRVAARMLERQLQAEDHERRLAEVTRIDRCEECGKTLGHLDDFSGLEGYCFNCV
jgi:hypothetical protein